MTNETKDWMEIFKFGLTAIAGVGFGALGVLKLAFKRERRFFDNAKRPVYLFEFGASLTSVKSAMESTEFLSSPKGPFKEAKDAHVLGNAGLVVMSFPAEPRNMEEETADLKQKRDDFFEVFEKVKTKELPIIVFSPGQGIQQSWGRLNYTRLAVCNFELRLISDVFSALSTYPPQKS